MELTERPRMKRRATRQEVYDAYEEFDALLNRLGERRYSNSLAWAIYLDVTHRREMWFDRKITNYKMLWRIQSNIADIHRYFGSELS